RHAAVVGEEADRVAVRAAAEAVIETLVVVDREARRLLVVERAARLPLAPGAEELHARRDHCRQHCARAQLVEKGGRKAHPERKFCDSRLAPPQGAEADLSTG